MKDVFKHEQLPSGKVILRHYGKDGALVDETHSYGPCDIGIQYFFKAGVKVDEMYFAKRRMVSRRTYEKARTTYTDMPKADDTLQDGCAELLRGAAREQRAHSMQARQHCPDQDEARKSDSFCRTVMDKGRREDALAWIQMKSHTLGERNWASSNRLVHRLSALGCVHIYACEIDADEREHENTGHLVIELPTEASARAKVFKMINRLAEETGYSGPFDDGQRYAYVKLD